MSEEFPAAEMHRGIRSMLDKDQRIAELEAQVEKMRKEYEHIAKREEHICEQCHYVLGCDNAFLASEALKEAGK